jgi:hypothetical protein
MIKKIVRVKNSCFHRLAALAEVLRQRRSSYLHRRASISWDARSQIAELLNVSRKTFNYARINSLVRHLVGVNFLGDRDVRELYLVPDPWNTPKYRLDYIMGRTKTNGDALVLAKAMRLHDNYSFGMELESIVLKSSPHM